MAEGNRTFSNPNDYVGRNKYADGASGPSGDLIPMGKNQPSPSPGPAGNAGPGSSTQFSSQADYFSVGFDNYGNEIPAGGPLVPGAYAEMGTGPCYGSDHYSGTKDAIHRKTAPKG